MPAPQITTSAEAWATMRASIPQSPSHSFTSSTYPLHAPLPWCDTSRARSLRCEPITGGTYASERGGGRAAPGPWAHRASGGPDVGRGAGNPRGRSGREGDGWSLDAGGAWLRWMAAARRAWADAAGPLVHRHGPPPSAGAGIEPAAGGFAPEARHGLSAGRHPAL